MVKIRFFGSTSYCGTDYEQIDYFDEMPDNNYLNEMAQELAEENAGSYEYLVGGWDFDPDECDPEELEEYESELAWYQDSIEYGWEIVPEDEDED